MSFKNYFFLLLFVFNLASCFSQQKSLEIKFERKADRSVELIYNKRSPGNTFVILKLNDLVNSDSPDVIRKVIKGYTGTLAKLEPSDENSWISFSISYNYIDGTNRAKPDLDFKYVLPFKNGSEVEVKEIGYLGTQYGNSGPVNWKCFQFLTKPNDTVYATRKGKVVKIVDEFHPDTNAEYSFKSKHNYLLIEHADGTIAKYGVIKEKSIMVKLGSKVYPDTPLALSGSYDKIENNQLQFSLFFVNPDIKEFSSGKTTLENQKHNYVYINPVFYSGETGVVGTLSNNYKYLAYCNERIVETEMSKKDKKKRLKNK